MATNMEEDDLINCPICFELFTNPKYLPCLHTFCGLCLKSYVISQLSGDNKLAKQFPCPVCRQIVQVPDLNISSDNIAELFPVNHLIVSLMDKRQGVSKKASKTDRLCDPCKQSGDCVTATVWCPTCFEALCENCDFYHKKLKQSRHHEIKPIAEVDEGNTTDVEEPCSEHFGKVLEVYCVDHKDMIATKHRKCENISTFDEMEKGEKGESVDKFKTELLEVDKKTDKIMTITTQNIDMLNKQHDKFAGEVSKGRAVSDSYNCVAEIETERMPDTPLSESIDEFQSTFSDQERTIVDIKDLEVSHLFSISVTGQITGGTFLPDGKMIFCDYDNNILKLYDKSGHIFTETTMRYFPWDATYVSENKVLVSAHNRSCIKKYDFSRERFHEVGEIFCKPSPEGLEYNDGKIIVGYRVTVDVITLDGKCLTTVDRKSHNNIHVVVPKPDRFYHNDRDSVVCRLVDGQELYRYSDKEVKGSCDIGSDCHVFVCGYTTGNVIAFSEEGQQSKVVITGLDIPFAIGFDSSGTRFFLSTIGTKRSLNVYRIN